MLLLLIVLIVGTVELVRTWRIVLSPTLSPESAKQLKRLQTAATSLKQWIYFTFLAWGFLASYQLTREGTVLSMERNPAISTAMPVIRGLLVELELTFLVIIFVFLVHWHIVRRIARFRD